MDQQVEIRPGRRLHLSHYAHFSSDTTLFLFHGLGGRGNQWREQIPILKEQYHLIVPDMVGHGSSPEPAAGARNPYGFSELEQDWQVLLDRYATKHNIVIAHSYGGALGASLTLHNQQKIEKLILITPMPCSPNFPIPLIYRLPTSVMELLRPLIELKYKQAVFTKDAPLHLVKTEMQAIHNTPISLFKKMIFGIQDMPANDMTKLKTPTLILTAMQDGLVPPQEQIDFYQHLPQHLLKQFPNAAHLIHLQKPHLVNPALLDFINN